MTPRFHYCTQMIPWSKCLVYLFLINACFTLHRLCCYLFSTFKTVVLNPNSINHPNVFTFHWSMSVFLVPLAFLGGLGGSGSQLKVVKLTASDGLPCKQLHMAWTLRKEEQWLQNVPLCINTVVKNRWRIILT